MQDKLFHAQPNKLRTCTEASLQSEKISKEKQNLEHVRKYMTARMDMTATVHDMPSLCYFLFFSFFFFYRGMEREGRTPPAVRWDDF